MRTAPVVIFMGLQLCALACANVPKNRNDGHFSSSMECVTTTDPACVGQATIGGECEMVLTNGTIQPCHDLRLVLHAVSPDNEERTAEISGSTFQFTGLNSRNYHLSAESDRYELETDTKDTLSPGQRLKIRVRAKPRP